MFTLKIYLLFSSLFNSNSYFSNREADTIERPPPSILMEDFFKLNMQLNTSTRMPQ